MRIALKFEAKAFMAILLLAVALGNARAVFGF